jgi:hypothetical protein
MIDFLSLIFDFFAICFLLLIVFVGVTLTYRALKAMFFNLKENSQEPKVNKRINENIINDSVGDGLLLFNDPLFPEETNEE